MGLPTSCYSFLDCQCAVNVSLSRCLAVSLSLSVRPSVSVRLCLCLCLSRSLSCAQWGTHEGRHVEFLLTRGPGQTHPRHLLDAPHDTVTPSCSRVPGLAHTWSSLAARRWPPFLRFFEGSAYMQPRKRRRAGGRGLTKASALAARTVAAKIFLHHIFHNCSQRARGKVGQPSQQAKAQRGRASERSARVPHPSRIPILAERRAL